MEKLTQTTKNTNSLKKAWNWLWHSDSIWSWIVSLVIAFVIVKFVFFPVLSLTLGTALPLVVVESSSMSHAGSGTFIGNVIGTQGSFESFWNENGQWYENRDIDKEEAGNWPLRTGFEKGDIMIVYGRSEPQVGDVIIFNANTQHPIIHRIVSIDSTSREIQTKGDNNPSQLSIEKSISENAVVGKAVVKIPKLGWVKLVFVEIVNAFS